MHLHTNPYRIFLLPTMCGSGRSSNRGETNFIELRWVRSLTKLSRGAHQGLPAGGIWRLRVYDLARVPRVFRQGLSRIFSSLSFTLEVPAAVADLQELWRSWGGRTESSATELQSYVAFALLIFIEEDDESRRRWRLKVNGLPQGES
ncbi:uncharacterized protein LOC125473467 [Pyrus x bretschneideri]|uniref:uncharacterized protein LOC125473467 n=1 Tax=Pyrus x bretschneideri TaxID=225117 RepID=UPI002030FB58|nr:uncharacterized protein LOC125473467 [Pyrus x bretschneideri]